VKKSDLTVGTDYAATRHEVHGSGYRADRDRKSAFRVTLLDLNGTLTHTQTYRAYPTREEGDVSPRTFEREVVERGILVRLHEPITIKRQAVQLDGNFGYSRCLTADDRVQHDVEVTEMILPSGRCFHDTWQAWEAAKAEEAKWEIERAANAREKAARVEAEAPRVAAEANALIDLLVAQGFTAKVDHWGSEKLDLPIPATTPYHSGWRHASVRVARGNQYLDLDLTWDNTPVDGVYGLVGAKVEANLPAITALLGTEVPA
jgi:hypothetical protein